MIISMTEGSKNYYSNSCPPFFITKKLGFKSFANNYSFFNSSPPNNVFVECFPDVYYLSYYTITNKINLKHNF